MKRCTIVCEAVLSDLDGVLVDSLAIVERHYRDFAARHGLDAQALLDDLHGRRMRDIIAAALPDWHGERLAEECARFEAAEAADADGLVTLAGAMEFTRALDGHAWAVVTSGTAPVAAVRLAEAGLPTPPVLVTGDSVTHGKPSAEPYETAARQLGADPSRCVVIEDAPAGVAAGLAAGSTVVAVAADGDVAPLAHAHHVVASLDGIEVDATGDGPLRLRFEDLIG